MTPGRWTGRDGIVVGDKREVCRLWRGGYSHEREGKATQDAIAALPDLIAELKAARDYIGKLVAFYESKPYRSSWEDDQLEQMRALLPETGGQS